MPYVAIIRDGFSDFLVFKKLIATLFVKHRKITLQEDNFIDMENVSICTPVVKYIDKANKESNYSYYNEDAKKILNELNTIYYAAYSRISKETGQVSNNDLIILNTDAEKLLIQRENYFKEWAYHIGGLLSFSIENFYEHMISYGYTYESLPLIIPIVPFPSSEIILAACLNNFHSDGLRQCKPTPELKQKVYGTPTISKALENGSLHEKLDELITDDGINKIYKELPEARMLIQSLSN